MVYAGAGASLYLVRSALDLIRIGAASDPSRRLRALQAGSPAPPARGGRARAPPRRRAPRRRPRPPHSRARSEKELDYQLRRRRERDRKQEQAATLLAQEMTQKDVAAAVAG